MSQSISREPRHIIICVNCFEDLIQEAIDYLNARKHRMARIAMQELLDRVRTTPTIEELADAEDDEPDYSSR